ncbi:primosomal protein N' [Kordiimonas sp. SCSIO 12610]|uniref:primosomal protein N' n=1 Tax=Kordiimonas sp. SCSIO 12610 TaxID=2829597 RepID=UPI00210B3E86|nr:primosomal protein N' [Kordiimonas sp. SCSIO 12610]
MSPRNQNNNQINLVTVLLPVPLNGGLLTYKIIDQIDDCVRGAFVEVPFARRKLVGILWDITDVTPDVSPDKIKQVLSILDRPPMTDELMRFIDWVATYTLSPLGAVFKMCISVPGLFEDTQKQKAYFYTGTQSKGTRLTSARQKVLDLMQDQKLQTIAEIKEKTGVSDSVIKGLEAIGILGSQYVDTKPDSAVPVLGDVEPELSEEQTVAASALVYAVASSVFKPFLLDGVTGAGKTEVYFEAIAEALKTEGTQVLVLVPEIALTSQWLGRFKTRFGVDPVVWHSDIAQGKRKRAWQAIASGDARVVVGARSALFLPYHNLSFIVVDEEHDQSFKQEEGVMYHARDMAIVRAKFSNCPIVLASATPSLETRVNADNGRFETLKLRERFGTAVLPEVKAVDMRIDPPAPGKWISPDLVKEIKDRIRNNEQVMLFLNRRGYAPLTLCRTCGHRFGCDECSSWLVEHRFRRELHCHHCGHIEPMPDKCPECGNADTLAPCGPGVERLFEEVAGEFPDARITVMTSDTMTSPKATAHMVEQIEKGMLDIVIGTQILTKGYHFPNLTLVGVIDADLGLRGGDLRAAERTYQQLMQVAGRAGRAEKPGTVYLQTYEPEHPVVDALVKTDGDSLMAMEQEMRERFQMPPFGRLVALILMGPELKPVAEMGRRLAQTAPREHVLNILGPAPAPLTRIRGQYRYRMLLHAGKSTKVQKMVFDWIERTEKIKGVRIKVDVDPYNFL